MTTMNLTMMTTEAAAVAAVAEAVAGGGGGGSDGGPRTPKKPKKRKKKGDKAPSTADKNRTGGGSGGGGGGGRDGGSPSPKRGKDKDKDKDKPMFTKTTSGSAWPITQCRLSADRVKIVQSKIDTSRGLNKGCCAARLLGEDGCDEDDRAGVIGKCGRSHQGPKDQQEQFCVDVAETAGLKVPYAARNYRF